MGYKIAIDFYGKIIRADVARLNRNDGTDAFLIESLSEELKCVKQERDAAVRDLAINRSCMTCKNEAGLKCAANGCAHDNEWQWRGVCAENGARHE